MLFFFTFSYSEHVYIKHTFLISFGYLGLTRKCYSIFPLTSRVLKDCQPFTRLTLRISSYVDFLKWKIICMLFPSFLPTLTVFISNNNLCSPEENVY